MTTIAYKDGYIACDTRMTQGNTIISDDYDKRLIVGNHTFYCAGATGDFPRMVEAFFNDDPLRGEEMCASALVWDSKDKTLWECGHDGEEFWKAPREVDMPKAMGSGYQHALTAMDMGASAKEAVRMAMKRDVMTGGKVRCYKLK